MKASVLLCASLVLGGVLFAQVPPEVAKEFAKSPKPPPANSVVGIDIDRFIGRPELSEAGSSHGLIVTRSILRHGDPYGPGAPGEVLQYRKDLMHGMLLGHNQTPLVTLPERLYIYVDRGQGRINDGSLSWELRQDIGVLVPAGAKHRITNTSDEPLHMILLFWDPEPDVTPADSILVRDVNQVPFHGKSHWTYLGKNVFNPAHGLHPQEGFHVVYVPPMSIGEPHAHVRQWEEIWLKLSPDDSYLTLGSEIREMPVYTAFLAPPNYQTVHAVINLNKERAQKWLFISHFIVEQKGYPEGPLVRGRPLEGR
jgi:hypothetical protein